MFSCVNYFLIILFSSSTSFWSFVFSRPFLATVNEVSSICGKCLESACLEYPNLFNSSCEWASSMWEATSLLPPTMPWQPKIQKLQFLLSVSRKRLGPYFIDLTEQLFVWYPPLPGTKAKHALQRVHLSEFNAFETTITLQWPLMYYSSKPASNYIIMYKNGWSGLTNSWKLLDFMPYMLKAIFF